MSTVPTHSLSFISSTILSQLDIILDGRVDHWKRSSVTSARCCTVLMYSIGPPFVIFPPSCHGHPRLHDCIVACSSISLLCYLSAKISFTPSQFIIFFLKIVHELFFCLRSYILDPQSHSSSVKKALRVVTFPEGRIACDCLDCFCWNISKYFLLNPVPEGPKR